MYINFLVTYFWVIYEVVPTMSHPGASFYDVKSSSSHAGENLTRCLKGREETGSYIKKIIIKALGDYEGLNVTYLLGFTFVCFVLKAQNRS